MERRLAAILAADVVGYSRLMEEATARTLNAYRKIVDRLVADHHGRVFGIEAAAFGLIASSG